MGFCSIFFLDTLACEWMSKLVSKGVGAVSGEARKQNSRSVSGHWVSSIQPRSSATKEYFVFCYSPEKKSWTKKNYQKKIATKKPLDNNNIRWSSMLIAAILTSGELERRDTPPIRRGDGRVRFCKPATAPPPYEMHGMRSEKPVELQEQPHPPPTRNVRSRPFRKKLVHRPNDLPELQQHRGLVPQKMFQATNTTLPPQQQRADPLVRISWSS